MRGRGRLRQSGGRRLGTRPAACDPRELRAGDRLHGVVVEEDRQAVPALERGGVGVRGAGRFPGGAFLGRDGRSCVRVREWRGRRTRETETGRVEGRVGAPRVRRWPGAHGASGRVQAECLLGLHDILGNLSEWVEDCYNKSYEGAPTDGRAWTMADCPRRVLRGGNWSNSPGGVSSANRNGDPPSLHNMERAAGSLRNARGAPTLCSGITQGSDGLTGPPSGLQALFEFHFRPC